MGFAIHKMVSCHVVAGIKTIKIALHSGEFFVSVAGKWFLHFIMFTLHLLGLNSLAKLGVASQGKRTRQHLLAKFCAAWRKTCINQTCRCR